MVSTIRYYEEELRGMDPLPTQAQARTLHTTGRFGRMFSLPSRSNTQPQPEELGPWMGGGEDDDNPDIPAGFTYLGQFLDHDITFDPTSVFEQQYDPSALENFRTPAFELDSLYGSGPAISSHLYDQNQPGKLLLDEDREFDLPRNSQGTALIGDPRNDEHLIIAQLHLAFLKFHNAVFAQANSINDNMPNETRFEKAQRLVRWHYQWIILGQFLPLIVAKEVLEDISQGGLKFYQWKGTYPYIPIEFSIAAYRFGHSQAQPNYRLNDNFEVGVLRLFSDKPPSGKRQDLQGGPIKKIHAINWKNFFDTGVPPTPGANRASKKIDTKLASPLLYLPPSVVSSKPRSLAVRNLLRGNNRGLPSGQDVAIEMAKTINLTPLGDDKVWEGLPQFEGKPAPLWYYILKEAEVLGKGVKLGPVGGRIVAEVFLGLLQADAESFLNRKRDWKPTIPVKRNGNFIMGEFFIKDLLTVAGVDTQ